MARESRTYEDRIAVDPEVMAGKPVVKGTRVPVELVLQRLASNPDVAELLAAYPHLTIEDVKACLGYARAVIEGEVVPAKSLSLSRAHS
jgi:uncharacterized protein (DUF433 family)